MPRGDGIEIRVGAHNPVKMGNEYLQHGNAANPVEGWDVSGQIEGENCGGGCALWGGHIKNLVPLNPMERPTKFEHTRFLGDKRTQLVYDVDNWEDTAVIDEIVAAEIGLCFGPDTLAEARNRGYTLATPGKTRRYLKPRA